MKTLRTNGTMPNGMSFNIEFVISKHDEKNKWLDVKLYCDGVLWDYATTSFGILRNFEEAFMNNIKEIETKNGINLIIENIPVTL